MTEYLILGIVGMLALILLTLFAYFVYSGLFHNIEVKTGKPPIRALRVAYKYGVGAYKNAGPLFSEVTKAAPELRCFGIYYDDPTKVPAEKLRYIVGTVIGEDGKDEANEETEKKLIDEDFKITKFPEVDHMVMSTFPYINILSCMIAIQRVYPVFSDYIVQNGLCAHPCMELYDDGVIYFLAPLAKQNEFYVPETGGLTPEQEQQSSDLSSKTEESSCSDEGSKDEAGTTTGSDNKVSGSESASSFEELNINESEKVDA